MNTLRYKPRIHLNRSFNRDSNGLASVGSLGIKMSPTGYAPQPIISPVMPSVPLEPLLPPPQFRYTREQLIDMLARGASETYERSGESETGLPTAFELEQRSREIDANKQYVIDADGEVITKEAPAPGAGIGLIAAAIAAFFIFGG